MDKKEIELIYEKYIRDIYRYSLFKVRDKHRAEDITSETFARLLEKSELNNIQNVKVYLIGIARNIVYEKYREEKKKVADFNLDDNYEEMIRTLSNTHQPTQPWI
jgi:RNA polymerase sigma-70 factor (ECF subfamily)